MTDKVKVYVALKLHAQEPAENGMQNAFGKLTPLK